MDENVRSTLECGGSSHRLPASVHTAKVQKGLVSSTSPFRGFIYACRNASA